MSLVDKDLPDRFWKKVDRNGPVHPDMDTRCWEWTASKTKDGYGRFKWGEKSVAAHRVAFLLTTGKSPEVVCHVCNNPSCVRPDHLYAGDHESNVLDIVIHRYRKMKDLS